MEMLLEALVRNAVWGELSTRGFSSLTSKSPLKPARLKPALLLVCCLLAAFSRGRLFCRLLRIAFLACRRRSRNLFGGHNGASN